MAGRLTVRMEPHVLMAGAGPLPSYSTAALPPDHTLGQGTIFEPPPNPWVRKVTSIQ